MAIKFKVGDKVKVVKNLLKISMENGFRVGSVGIVVGIDGGDYAPYLVEKRNGNSENFNVKELERIQ